MSTPHHNKYFKTLSEELIIKTHNYSNEDLNVSLNRLQAEIILDSIFTSSNLKTSSRDPSIASSLQACKSTDDTQEPVTFRVNNPIDIECLFSENARNTRDKKSEISEVIPIQYI